jgi:peptidoglycan/LPS O-acetylase OafA/YrhL
LTLPLFGINAAFIFGVLSAKLRWRISPWLALLIGVALLVLVELLPTRLNMIQTTAGLALMVMGVLNLEHRGMLPRLPLLRRLGDWSYAMYLVHVPVILGTCKLLGNSPTWLVMATGFAAVLLVSACIGQVDVVSYRRLKNSLDRGPRAVRFGVAIAFVGVFAASALWGLCPVLGSAGTCR